MAMTSSVTSLQAYQHLGCEAVPHALREYKYLEYSTDNYPRLIFNYIEYSSVAITVPYGFNTNFTMTATISFNNLITMTTTISYNLSNLIIRFQTTYCNHLNYIRLKGTLTLQQNTMRNKNYGLIIHVDVAISIHRYFVYYVT